MAARVGLLVQLRLGPEYGPGEGMDDRMPLIEALYGYRGEWPSTDSGSRSTNVKCWDIDPEKWDDLLRFTLSQLESLGLLGRATVVRLDYDDPGEDQDPVWGPETVVWPKDHPGQFKQFPEWPNF